jgi:hypothetical protein
MDVAGESGYALGADDEFLARRDIADGAACPRAFRASALVQPLRSLFHCRAFLM